MLGFICRLLQLILLPIYQDGTLKMELIQNSEYLSKLAETFKEERAKSGSIERIEDVVSDTTPVKEFLSGKHCLTGVSWRQFFEDKRLN